MGLARMTPTFLAWNLGRCVLLIEMKNVEGELISGGIQFVFDHMEFEVHMQQTNRNFHLTITYTGLEFDRGLGWGQTFGSDYSIGYIVQQWKSGGSLK